MWDGINFADLEAVFKGGGAGAIAGFAGGCSA
jgi:hypothetical protein